MVRLAMDIRLPNIVAIGYYNSDIAAKNKTITKNRNTTMFEIEIPSTDGGVSYIDLESHKISPNMLICAKPGQTRRTKLPFKCYFIHMIVEDKLLLDMLNKTPNFFETIEIEPYKKLFKKLYKYSNNSSQIDSVIQQSLVLELIYKLYNDTKLQSNAKILKSENYEIIKNVIDYISKNLNHNLSLGEVSEYVGFSPIYFHKLFKASTGLTLHQYIEDLRIKKASTLLVTTDKTLAEIAYICGFSSQSYFSYAFKQKMKLTPRQYVRDHFKQY